MSEISTPPPQRTSAWPKILLGCFALLVLGTMGVIVLWKVATRTIGEAVVENMTNPALRAERAKKMLGTSKLPDGYYPTSSSMNLPFLAHVELSDRAPDKNGLVVDFDKRGFIFTASLYVPEPSAEKERFFTGAPGAPPAAVDVGFRYRVLEELGKGTIRQGKETIRYRAVRGRVDRKVFETEGPMVLMWIECADIKHDRKKERHAVWFSPDASITNESSIRTFMAPFDLCRER